MTQCNSGSGREREQRRDSREHTGVIGEHTPHATHAHTDTIDACTHTRHTALIHTHTDTHIQTTTKTRAHAHTNHRMPCTCKIELRAEPRAPLPLMDSGAIPLLPDSELALEKGVEH